MHSYYPIDFKKDIQKIAAEVCETFSDVDIIFGISRGGLTAATALSYKLNVPLAILDPKDIDGLSYDYKGIIGHYLNCNMRVLIVDDMIDSGNVIGKILKKYKLYNINEPDHHWYHAGDLRTAVLIYNTNQEIVPNFFGRTIDRSKNMNYIRFFWENVDLIYN